MRPSVLAVCATLAAAGALPAGARRAQELEWERGDQRLDQLIRRFRGSITAEEGLWGAPQLDFGLVQQALRPEMPLRPPARGQTERDAQRAATHAEHAVFIAELAAPPADAANDRVLQPSTPAWLAAARSRDAGAKSKHQFLPLDTY